MRRSANRAARYAAQGGLSSRKHGCKWHYKFGDSWNSISLPTRNQRLARNLPIGLSKLGESPRLLLNSASPKFPDGMANSSGQVGRNYMRHTTGSVYAIFDKPVHMYRGTTMAGIIRDESGHDPERGFAGGYELETLSLGLPFMAAFLEPGAWGRGFTSAMDAYDHMAGLWIVGEDMPQERNRVTLDPNVKDKFGLPVASVHFDDHRN